MLWMAAHDPRWPLADWLEWCNARTVQIVRVYDRVVPCKHAWLVGWFAVDWRVDYEGAIGVCHAALCQGASSRRLIRAFQEWAGDCDEAGDPHVPEGARLVGYIPVERDDVQRLARLAGFTQDNADPTRWNYGL